WLFLAGMVATPWGAFAQDNAFAKIASSSQAAVVKIEAKSADQEPRNCLGFFIGSREVMTSANCLEAIAGVRQFKPFEDFKILAYDKKQKKAVEVEIEDMVQVDFLHDVAIFKLTYNQAMELRPTSLNLCARGAQESVSIAPQPIAALTGLAGSVPAANLFGV